MAFTKPSKRSEQEWKAFKHYLANPVEAVKDWFGVTPDDWQGDVLNGVFKAAETLPDGTIIWGKDRVGYKAAHGVGKSTVDAWAGWIFLNGYEDCRLVATAPTIHQLTDALWPEYAKWHNKMPKRMQDEWQLSATHIRHKINPYEWFAVARTSNKPANLQGFHKESLMIQGDEASAIPENVFEVIEGTLSEAGDEGKVAKLMIGGNPNFASGELYNVFNRNLELYHGITITGDPEWFATLGIKQGEFVPGHGHVYYSKRVRPRYVATMEKKYGRDSAIFDVRVRGIFPRAADDVIIPWEWANRAPGIEGLPTFDPIADQVTLVVDPSRGGGAETALGLFRRGLPYKLWAFKNGTTSTTPVIDAVNEAILQEIIGKGLLLAEIVVDEPGIGGGVIDVLRKQGLPVRAYNGGINMKANVDSIDDFRQFVNIRSRDWWSVRRKLELGLLPLPGDLNEREILIGQLTSLKYKYQHEKILCESKDDLKDRLGKEASPDRADVIVMGTSKSIGHIGAVKELSEEDVQYGEDRPTAYMPD